MDFFLPLNIQISTQELGYFKLIGRPVLHGGLSAKQMIGAVYTVPNVNGVTGEAVTLEVYIIDGLPHCREVCVYVCVMCKKCVCVE